MTSQTSQMSQVINSALSGLDTPRCVFSYRKINIEPNNREKAAEYLPEYMPVYMPESMPVSKRQLQLQKKIMRISTRQLRIARRNHNIYIRRNGLCPTLKDLKKGQKKRNAARKKSTFFLYKKEGVWVK